jgi:hypothetical protein
LDICEFLELNGASLDDYESSLKKIYNPKTKSFANRPELSVDCEIRDESNIYDPRNDSEAIYFRFVSQAGSDFEYINSNLLIDQENLKITKPSPYIKSKMNERNTKKIATTTQTISDDIDPFKLLEQKRKDL